MDKKLLKIILMAVWLIFSFYNLVEAQEWRNLNLSQVKISDYGGPVEVKRQGKELRLKKGLALKDSDEISIYAEGYLEIYFEDRKDIRVRINEENEFMLKEILKTAPYAMETRYNPKKKVTQVVLMFKPKTWYNKQVEALLKGKIPVTVVLVREEVVRVQGRVMADSKEVLVPEGYMTYVFEGKVPFPPIEFEECIELCLEEE